MRQKFFLVVCMAVIVGESVALWAMARRVDLMARDLGEASARAAEYEARAAAMVDQIDRLDRAMAIYGGAVHEASEKRSEAARCVLADPFSMDWLHSDLPSGVCDALGGHGGTGPAVGTAHTVRGADAGGSSY